MRTCKVKLNHASDATPAICNGNMKLIQQPGEEKLLISKQKALSLQYFCMKIFCIENRSIFLLLDKPGSSELRIFFHLNLLQLETSSQQNLKEWLCQNYVNFNLWFSKVSNLYNNNSQAISFEYSFRHRKYFLQQSFVSNVSFRYNFWSYMTDIPTINYSTKLFLQQELSPANHLNSLSLMPVILLLT